MSTKNDDTSSLSQGKYPWGLNLINKIFCNSKFEIRSREHLCSFIFSEFGLYTLPKFDECNRCQKKFELEATKYLYKTRRKQYNKNKSRLTKSEVGR